DRGGLSTNDEIEGRRRPLPASAQDPVPVLRHAAVEGRSCRPRADKEQGIERWRPCVPIGCPLWGGFRSPATDRAWVPPCDPLDPEPNPAEPMLRIGQIVEDPVRLPPHTYL